jgi:magnesium-transporting ATPase (P-type)
VDEVCLLEMAFNCRLLYFWDKDSQHMRYKQNEVINNATLIRTLKFTAERKAMSVIVEIEGKTYVYLKGADSYVLPKCKT